MNAQSQAHPNFQCGVPQVVTWAHTMFICHYSCSAEGKRVEGSVCCERGERGTYLTQRTLDAEEETNLPEMAEMP